MTAMTLKRALDALMREGSVVADVGEVDGKPARFYSLLEKVWPKDVQELYNRIQALVVVADARLSARGLAKARAICLLASTLAELMRIHNSLCLKVMAACSEIEDPKRLADTFIRHTLFIGWVTLDNIMTLCSIRKEIAPEACSLALGYLKPIKKAP